jgi:hypothetical protein
MLKNNEIDIKREGTSEKKKMIVMKIGEISEKKKED